MIKNLEAICRDILEKMRGEMGLLPLFARTFLAEVGGVVGGLYSGKIEEKKKSSLKKREHNTLCILHM